MNDYDLCNGCGTCLSICPSSAIKASINHNKGIYVFGIDDGVCTGCGLCYEVCPGHNVDFDSLNKEIFGKVPDDIFIGNVLQAYAGYAADKDLRYRATSGGVTSALLHFALESGFVDGAIVTKMDENNPLRTKPFIAITHQEVNAAMGSKYCPAPTNIAIKEVLKRNGRYALIGLPCHIHGLRKAQDKIPALKEKLVLQLSLFCGMNFTYKLTEWFLRQIGVEKDSVADLKYRCNGYPGSIKITKKNNDIVSYPLESYYLPEFKSTRCTLCSDAFGELADISIGDAWLPEFKSDHAGRNIVVVRTRKGLGFIQQAQYAKIVCLDRIELSKIIESNKRVAIFKKKVRARLKLFNIVGKKTPVYNQQLLKVGLWDYVTSIRYYIMKYLKRKAFEILPSKIINGLRKKSIAIILRGVE